MSTWTGTEPETAFAEFVRRIVTDTVAAFVADQGPRRETYTTIEAAAVLGLHPDLVRSRCADGTFPTLPRDLVGSKFLIPKPWLDDLIATAAASTPPVPHLVPAPHGAPAGGVDGAAGQRQSEAVDTAAAG